MWQMIHSRVYNVKRFFDNNKNSQQNPFGFFENVKYSWNLYKVPYKFVQSSYIFPGNLLIPTFPKLYAFLDFKIIKTKRMVFLHKIQETRIFKMVPKLR